MSLVRATSLLACVLVTSGFPAADGGIAVYLQPFPPEAGKLTFTVAAAAAVASNGTEYPLTLRLRTVGPAESGQQHLLASGRLPVGRYAGVRLTITHATLKNSPTDTTLVVPDDPVRVDAPFSVEPEHTPLLWLTLKSQDSITEAVKFTPSFLALTPPVPVPDNSGFVSNSDSDSITVFDKRDAQVVAVIDTCAGPAGLALDQRRRLVYVACVKDNEIQAIDVAALEIVQRGQLSPGDGPSEVALTPDGATLISVNPGSNSISFFDAASLTRQERLNVGGGPASIVIDPAGRRAFVFNRLSTSVSVIDIAGRSLVTTLSMDAPPLRGQFDASGTQLYVIHERSPFLTVIAPRQLSFVTRARLGSTVAAIAYDKVRGLLCVGGDGSTDVEFYDPNVLMPLYAMTAKPGIVYMAIDSVDNRLYMVDPGSRTVMVGDLANRKLVSEIDVGDNPYWVAVMGDR